MEPRTEEIADLPVDEDVRPGGSPLRNSTVASDEIPESRALNGKMPGVLLENEKRIETQKVDNEREEGWSFLLDSARGYDQEKLDGWKSDLDNLLVFAALFSAIVTAFTIESYQWLQDDPAQMSVQLLSQISLQLSSFSTGQNFINSTTGPLPPFQPFRPDPNDLNINMMWFLSLTFSLLASFFTLAVQQWLRAYVLPKQLSVRDSVRLRQSRYDALLIWQVPNIIIFLPVVLQAAVVLFLIGVLLLLRNLSHPIMAAFAVVSGVPFFLYAFSLILPLMWPSCPFKSPLVPATSVVLNWCLVPLAIAAFFLVFVPLIIISWVSRLFLGGCGGYFDLNDTRDTLRRSAIKPYIFIMYILRSTISLGVHVFGEMNEFWTAREVRDMAHDTDDDHTDEDAYALEWVIREVPQRQLDALKTCLFDIPEKKRIQCVLCWLAVSTGEYDETVYGYAGAWCPVDPIFLSRISLATIHQWKDYLLEVLPQDWESQDMIREDENVSCILVLLTHMIRLSPVDKRFVASFNNLLLKIWHAQRVERLQNAHNGNPDYDWVHIPAVCLFHVWVIQPTQLNIQQTLQLLSTTKARLSELISLNLGLIEQLNVEIATTDLALASTAVSLLAVQSQLPTASQEDRVALQEGTDALLALFDQYLTSQRRNIQFLSSLCLDHPKRTVIFCAPKALASIGESLAGLAAASLLPGSASSTLVGHLVETCEGHPALEAALASCNKISLAPGVTKHSDDDRPTMPVLTLRQGTRLVPNEGNVDSAALSP